MSADPRLEIDKALYQLGVIADVMRAVATANLSGGRPVCGTAVQWFSEQIEFQHNRIDLALGPLNRRRGTAPPPD